MIAVGGTSDHIHLLVKMGTNIAISDLARKIKSISSKIMNEEDRSRRFAWQPGYGVFSVSHSMVDVVKTYIANQEKHHSKNAFQDEFVKLLEKHEIIYDERYILG